MDTDWDEEEEKSGEVNTPLDVNSKTGSSTKDISIESPSIASQLCALDPEKIY